MNGRPKKLLVVDDDKIIVRLLEMRLKKSPYEVMTADTAGQALEKLAEFRPDLVIVDVRLPDRSGFTLYRDLKKSPRTETIPVIFITAFGKENLPEWEEIKKSGRGLVFFLDKPFSGQKLQELIETALGVKSGEEAPERFEDWSD